MTEMVWLDSEDPRWTEAWAGLETEFGDRVAESLTTGECWQYMGSVVRENPGSWPARQFANIERLVSQFRHRDFDGERRYWNFWHEAKAEAR